MLLNVRGQIAAFWENKRKEEFLLSDKALPTVDFI